MTKKPDYVTMQRKQENLKRAYDAKRKEVATGIESLIQRMHEADKQGRNMIPTTRDLTDQRDAYYTLKDAFKRAFIAGCSTEANCATQDMRGEEQYGEWFERWFLTQPLFSQAPVATKEPETAWKSMTGLGIDGKPLAHKAPTDNAGLALPDDTYWYGDDE